MMLMSLKFKAIKPENGTVTIPRRGIASSVIIPEDLIQRIGYDANLDEEKSAVVFSEGDTVYILTDRFGVLGGKHEEVDTNIFFVEDGVLIELISGKIILEGENGELYYVDEVGDIDYPSGNAKMTFYDTNHVLDIAKSLTKYKYGLPDSLVNDYVDNLLYNIQFHYVNTDTGYVANMRIVDYYGDLAMEKFIFTDYNESTEYDDEDDDISDVGDLVPIDDDEDEEDEDDYDMDKDEFSNVF